MPKKGWRLRPREPMPFLVVLNTCTVMSSANGDVRQTIRPVHRETRRPAFWLTAATLSALPRNWRRCRVSRGWSGTRKMQIAELVTAAVCSHYPTKAQDQQFAAPCEGDRARAIIDHCP